jgi:hypothetical protein
MHRNRVSLTFLFVAAIFTLAFTSCAPRVTKGSVGQEVSKCIRIQSDKSQVIKYIDSLEVNAVKPTRYDYVRDTSRYPVIAPDGKEVKVEGTIYASFANEPSPYFDFCNHVGVIFYFDKSDKLITYHIDCFG